MVVPEARPFAKTGGLADVAGALPAALARLGHDVTIILPRYRGVHAIGAAATPAEIPFGGARQRVEFLELAQPSGVRAVFVDAPELFDRPALYGVGNDDYPDNAYRFAVLSRAALEYLRLREQRPSAIHIHDWQTGLVPVYQQIHYAGDPFVGGVPVVLTIHNLAFQGLFPPSVLSDVDLPWHLFHVDALEYWGKVSYLKGGINFSRRITTVSPEYAREILTPELGFGFDGILGRRASDVSGILNGIDTEAWNPRSDPFLETHFDARSPAAKSDVKRQLLERCGFVPNEAAMARPVIGMVSRFTDQKGFDLIERAADALLALDATWTVLGGGDPRYERFWIDVAARHPDRVSITVGFDEALAHLIEGGADLFLMPSRFEPCGLNQMYSLRYGTIPVVRATGGLDDTVVDADEPGAEGNGFKFSDYTPAALVGAVERALAAYRQPRRWRALQRAGMRQDHSWDVSAREYVKVYRAVGGP